MNAVSQSEFARLQQWARSYVTALKKAGRLVLDDAGRVLVEESRRRIAETADPGRDDVRARHASERATAPADDAPEDDAPDGSAGGHDYHAARAKKEHYLAEQARLAFEREDGKLVERVDVEAAVLDVMTLVRQALENMPHRTAADLVGKDLDAVRAILRQEVHGVLTEMEREFSRRVEAMGEGVA